MTNIDIAISTLAAHREARRWDDAVVAADLLTRLGIDPNGEHGLSDPLPEEEAGTHQDIETKHYSDGTSATGPGPLPDMLPEQQGAHDDAARAADYKDQLDAALNHAP